MATREAHAAVQSAPDGRATFAGFARLPNVKVFLEQVDAFQGFLGTTPLSKAQMRDLDLLLVVGGYGPKPAQPPTPTQ
ncbi:hypothetical protein GUY60_33230 [Streptomyces sp. YC537]|uniref:Uncharacterized protein n=1 Tax=Streptomyces boluensis TaxID=1775135 RepID=A0A964XQF6_9ACTN|nr:hypothetical protein [Streptomyces boluensis]